MLVVCFNLIVYHILLLASSFDDIRIVRFWTIKFASYIGLR